MIPAKEERKEKDEISIGWLKELIKEKGLLVSWSALERGAFEWIISRLSHNDQSTSSGEYKYCSDCGGKIPDDSFCNCPPVSAALIESKRTVTREMERAAIFVRHIEKHLEAQATGIVVCKICEKTIDEIADAELGLEEPK